MHTARLTAENSRNAVRQLVCWPTQVPSGTPSTGPSELPMVRRAIILPRTAGANRLAAAGVTVAQNSACPSAVNMRAAMRSAYPKATVDQSEPIAQTAVVAPKT